jgi:hypothetical protein
LSYIPCSHNISPQIDYGSKMKLPKSTLELHIIFLAQGGLTVAIATFVECCKRVSLSAGG